MTPEQKDKWVCLCRAMRRIMEPVLEEAERDDIPFAVARCEAIMDDIDAFEVRLNLERLSAPLCPCAGVSVKPRPDPDTGRGVFLSGNKNNTTTRKDSVCE